jgi:hypothetical protein
LPLDPRPMLEKSSTGERVRAGNDAAAAGSDEDAARLGLHCVGCSRAVGWWALHLSPLIIWVAIPAVVGIFPLGPFALILGIVLLVRRDPASREKRG